MATEKPIVFRPHEPEPVRQKKLQDVLARLIAAEEITLNDVVHAVAGLTPAANTAIYFSAADTAHLFSLTPFARTILDDTGAEIVRSTLGSSLFRDVTDTAIIGASNTRYWLNSGPQSNTVANPALAQFVDLSGRQANTEWVRFHNDAKPVILQLGKNRGDGIPGSATFGRKTLANDRLAMLGLYGGKDSDGTTTAFAHAGYITWTAEADNDGSNEINTAVHIQPGSTLAKPGKNNGLEINCLSQAAFAGPNQAGYGPGIDHGAILTLGVGGDGTVPLKFTLASAALVTSPIPGAVEVDTGGRLYITSGSGQRHVIFSARNPNLNAIEGLVSAANTFPYFTGAGTAALATLIAWAAYTPTVEAATGTLTAATATGRYAQIGKTVFFQIEITITTNGTGASRINTSLPVASVALFAGAGRSAGGAKSLSTWQAAVGTQLRVQHYDGTYPGADGALLIISGAYEVA